LEKIGAQTTFWSSGIDALRCLADATIFFKGTGAATCSDASFLQANIILFPSIFHAQMPCYPSLAAHDFSDYTTVNGISLYPYVVRAVPQKTFWASMMRWLPFDGVGTGHIAEGLISPFHVRVMCGQI
jgi:hypothetical protein